MPPSVAEKTDGTNEKEDGCVVCLTDRYTCWGDDPGLPVLWALTADSSAEPPFGQTVRIGK